jgi:hypothetical protein
MVLTIFTRTTTYRTQLMLVDMGLVVSCGRGSPRFALDLI